MKYANLVRFNCFTSLIKPKNAKKASMDEYWVKAM